MGFSLTPTANKRHQRHGFATGLMIAAIRRYHSLTQERPERTSMVGCGQPVLLSNRAKNDAVFNSSHSYFADHG